MTFVKTSHAVLAARLLCAVVIGGYGVSASAGPDEFCPGIVVPVAVFTLSVHADLDEDWLMFRGVPAGVRCSPPNDDLFECELAEIRLKNPGPGLDYGNGGAGAVMEVFDSLGNSLAGPSALFGGDDDVLIEGIIMTGGEDYFIRVAQLRNEVMDPRCIPEDPSSDLEVFIPHGEDAGKISGLVVDATNDQGLPNAQLIPDIGAWAPSAPAANGFEAGAYQLIHTDTSLGGGVTVTAEVLRAGYESQMIRYDLMPTEQKTCTVYLTPTASRHAKVAAGALGDPFANGFADGFEDRVRPPQGDCVLVP